MKKLILLVILSGLAVTNWACSNANGESKTESITTTTSGNSSVIHLDAVSFKEQVFDYENNQTWKYEGKVPAILDFYADWCEPCKMLAPHLEELQKEYGDKIQIYKVNTDKQKELAATFGIRSLPTIVFIPMDGDPQAAMGYRPKEELETMITEILKVEK